MVVSPKLPLASPHVVIIGGGPAGLMMADILSASANISVSIYDAMPSLGRKFLQAGKGGLNLTHSEPFEAFLARYSSQSEILRPALAAFDATKMVEWVASLGVETFVGSSGRIFPKDMKAAPLLRAWLHRLRLRNVNIYVHHRWNGWSDTGHLRFLNREKEVSVVSDAVVFALGGASWPHLGSDGKWLNFFQKKLITVSPFLPSNSGFLVHWPAWFSERHAGDPLKSVIMVIQTSASRIQQQGDAVVSADGVEGGLVYALSAHIRDQYLLTGSAEIILDLLPQQTVQDTHHILQKPYGSKSLSQIFKQRLSISGVKFALLKALLPERVWLDKALLAHNIHALSIPVAGTRPIEEAISTAGGVSFDEVNEYFMLNKLPGTFVVGEMLDWEAPTGGYLLTMSMATAVRSAAGVQQWIAKLEKPTVG